MEIVRAGAERIPDLQPLWASLSRHHGEVAPELSILGELRSEADSWAVRRALYEEWLAEPDAFVLRCRMAPIRRVTSNEREATDRDPAGPAAVLPARA